MGKWKEIRCNFINEDEKTICIDAWKTTSPNEEGKTIAKIQYNTKEVIYIDEAAESDDYAQEVIQRVLKQIK